MTSLQTYLAECKARVAQGNKPETIVFSLSSYMREQAKLIEIVECLREGLDYYERQGKGLVACSCGAELPLMPGNVKAREALAKADQLSRDKGGVK